MSNPLTENLNTTTVSKSLFDSTALQEKRFCFKWKCKETFGSEVLESVKIQIKNPRNKPLKFYHLRTSDCQSSLLQLIFSAALLGEPCPASGRPLVPFILSLQPAGVKLTNGVIYTACCFLPLAGRATEVEEDTEDTGVTGLKNVPRLCHPGMCLGVGEAHF